MEFFYCSSPLLQDSVDFEWLADSVDSILPKKDAVECGDVVGGDFAIAVDIAGDLVKVITIEQVIIYTCDIIGSDNSVAVHVTLGHAPLLIEPCHLARDNIKILCCMFLRMHAG